MSIEKRMEFTKEQTSGMNEALEQAIKHAFLDPLGPIGYARDMKIIGVEPDLNYFGELHDYAKNKIKSIVDKIMVMPLLKDLGQDYENIIDKEEVIETLKYLRDEPWRTDIVDHIYLSPKDEKIGQFTILTASLVRAGIISENMQELKRDKGLLITKEERNNVADFAYYYNPQYRKDASILFHLKYRQDLILFGLEDPIHDKVKTEAASLLEKYLKHEAWGRFVPLYETMLANDLR